MSAIAIIGATLEKIAVEISIFKGLK